MGRQVAVTHIHQEEKMLVRQMLKEEREKAYNDLIKNPRKYLED